HAPQVKPEHLGTLHTLRDVANFLTGPSSTTAPTVEFAPAKAAADSDSIGIGDSPADDDPGVRTLLINKARQSASIKTTATARMPAAATPMTGPDPAKTLLAVVSEKTGYPVESLDLSLSLDGDLGVDSIKRVEILSTLQERLPHAPQVKPEHLGTLHTLRDVANFLTGPANGTVRLSDSVEIPTAVHAVVPVSPTKSSPPTVSETERVSTVPPSAPERPKRQTDITRHPGARTLPQTGMVGTDCIDRSILQVVDLDVNSARPGISLAADGEFWVVGEPDALTESLVGLLTERGFAPHQFAWNDAFPTDVPAVLSGSILISPIASEPELNRRAFLWLKHAAFAIEAGHAGFRRGAHDRGPPRRRLRACTLGRGRRDLRRLRGTRQDRSPRVPRAVLQGGRSVAGTFRDAGGAAALAEELMLVGPMEVGIAPTHRCTLELAHTVRRSASQLIKLGKRDVILITGGARGVTAEVAVTLAETYGCSLVLTGRTQLGGPEPEWSAGFTEEADLKRAIAAKLGPVEGGPRQVGDYYSKLMAQREVRETLRRIEQTGAKVTYIPVNITHADAVAATLNGVRSTVGPITAVIHGAGVLADKRIEDLSGEQFDRVYATKVDGLQNLLKHLGTDELKALVLFSSTTARLGRTGQVAYACANEVLNKMAQLEARRRPSCRVVSINWGPWEGGMVTPGLRKIFESEGVGLIPLLEGAIFLVQELSPGKSVEVGALGKAKPPGSGSGVVPLPPLATPARGMPGLGSGTVPSPDMTPTFERTVDTVTHPILKSHVLDGKAVLPMALHLEWLAHAALHGNPGYLFHGFNDLRVTAGVQIDASGPVQVRAFASKAVKQDKLLVVPVQLRSKRKDGRDTIHSRAEIVLTSSLPTPPPADRPPTVQPVTYSVAQAYREQLFHGAAMRGIERIEGMSAAAFIGTALPAPTPGDWFLSPLRSSWLADPLVLDVSFQMMILWTQGQHQTGSLPCFAGRYRQYRKTFPSGPTTVVIRIRRDDGIFARADIDYLDAEGRVIAQMQDYECVMEKTLNEAFRKNQFGR
ncbi:MAG: SDR family NAD(P)-dependent oxidoreductase, partial [Gemmataceae bacterium]